MEAIKVGDKVKITAHHVMRHSPYKGKVGTVDFVPPDGQWPFIVSVLDFDTAINGKTACGGRYPWPTTFARNEIERVTGNG